MKFDLGSFVLGALVVALVGAQMMGYVDMAQWASVSVEALRAMADFLATL